jgi:hypothetical protein
MLGLCHPAAAVLRTEQSPPAAFCLTRLQLDPRLLSLMVMTRDAREGDGAACESKPAAEELLVSERCALTNRRIAAKHGSYAKGSLDVSAQ